MIGILGGMGTQAGLDFCTKLAKINRGKADQNYPLFVLYNKATIPDRKKNLKKYKKVLNSLLEGCKFLQKNKCKFISIPCNTAHYWYSDLKNKVKIPILNMPELVYKSASRSCKKQTKIGLLATDATIKTKIYSNFFNKNFELCVPPKNIQINNVNKSIKFVKMGKTKEAEEQYIIENEGLINSKEARKEKVTIFIITLWKFNVLLIKYIYIGTMGVFCLQV